MVAYVNTMDIRTYSFYILAKVKNGIQFKYSSLLTLMHKCGPNSLRDNDIVWRNVLTNNILTGVAKDPESVCPYSA